MKKAIIYLLAANCGLLAFISSASAQTTIFSDDFASDSSLGPSWYNLNNTSAASYALNPTAGQGLALTVNSGSTGKVNEMFSEFNSVTLSDGDSLSLTAIFNSPSGMSTDTGGLLVGLYNNSTVNSTNEQGSSNGSTGTGGETAASQGYFGIMGYNTSAGTSTKFYSRQGGATDANELGYYSEMTGSSYTQLSSSGAANNANLQLNINYTLTYTITDEGASGNQISAMISNGSSILDSWTTTDSSGLYDTFNELDFGNYGKAAAVDINILSESVTEITPAPEPSVMALVGAAFGAFGMMRFRRR
ncbi:MAG TPA: PEP-CTERM sorting domain-containing protein [Candidatus Sulfotelmatobacter sp.]|nr:PEP-CTERM sorting domain-containing protein [Candidatus Sulfotelmatobacter sp.]